MSVIITNDLKSYVHKGTTYILSVRCGEAHEHSLAPRLQSF